MDKSHSTQIVVAIIGAAAVVIAAAIGGGQIPGCRPEPVKRLAVQFVPSEVAPGQIVLRAVDADTGRPVRNAALYVLPQPGGLGSNPNMPILVGGRTPWATGPDGVGLVDLGYYLNPNFWLPFADPRIGAVFLFYVDAQADGYHPARSVPFYSAAAPTASPVIVSRYQESARQPIIEIPPRYIPFPNQ